MSTSSLILAGYLACGMAPGGNAAGSPFDGAWWLFTYPGGRAFCSVEVDVGLAPRAVSLSSVDARFSREKSVVRSSRIEQDALRFELRLAPRAGGRPLDMAVDIYAGEGGAIPRLLLGSAGEPDGSRYAVEFVRKRPGDEPAEVRPWKDNPKISESMVSNAHDRIAALDRIVSDYPGHPAVYTARAAQLLAMIEDGRPEPDLRRVADQAIGQAARYGREMELFATHWAAWGLAESKTDSRAALDYARRAEKLLRPDDPPAIVESVLRTLVWSLRKCGREVDAPLAARIASAAERWDREDAAACPRFRPKAEGDRPKSKGRTVLVEFFTGARCNPCVAADLAFDAVLDSCDADDVVAIQYHLEIPGYDLLSNPDAVSRADYYGLNRVPAVVIDGKAGPEIGGPVEDAEAGYIALREAAVPRPGGRSTGSIDLRLTRRESVLEIRSKVDRPASGEHPLRLRYALVEERVRYAGRNGRRVHRNVVRTLPGGADGVLVAGKVFEHSVAVDLEKTSSALEADLRARAGERHFPDNYHVTGFGRLAVVAFVQEEETHSVLQARQVAVP